MSTAASGRIFRDPREPGGVHWPPLEATCSPSPRREILPIVLEGHSFADAFGSKAIGRGASKLILDLEKTVVLRQALSSRRGTSFDLATARGHRKVGDERVRSFAGAMRDHLGVRGLTADRDGFECLGDGADLVELDQGSVGDASVHGVSDDCGVGDEDVVADELHPIAETLREAGPAIPIVLGQAVFDGPDRVAANERLVVVGQLRRRAELGGAIAVAPVGLAELRGSRIEGHRDALPARLVPG